MLLLWRVQVIEEIEEMMQDSPDMEPEHNPSQSYFSMLSLDVQRAASSPSYEKSECPLIKSDTNKQFYIVVRSPVTYTNQYKLTTICILI